MGSVEGDPSLADFEVDEIGEAPEMHQPRISDVCLAELERCEAFKAEGSGKPDDLTQSRKVRKKEI